MATKSIEISAEARGHVLSVPRVLASAGITAALVFVLCWLGTFVTFSSPTHAYIGLFTPADASSVQALVEGTVWSLLFGALSGAVFGLVYNATRALQRS